jgi:hypothetical protein
MKRFQSLGIAAILLVCGALEGTQVIATGSKEAILAEVNQSGGLTVRGPAHSEFVVFESGKFDWSSESVPLTHGTIEAGDLLKLRTEMDNTDFSKWTMTPAQTRPSAADGSDITVCFWIKGHKQPYRLWEMQEIGKNRLVNILLSMQAKYRAKAQMDR